MDNIDELDWDELKKIKWHILFIILLFTAMVLIWPYTDMVKEERAYQRQQTIITINQHYGLIDQRQKKALMDQFNITEDELNPYEILEIMGNENHN